MAGQWGLTLRKRAYRNWLVTGYGERIDETRAEAGRSCTFFENEPMEKREKLFVNYAAGDAVS